jgi:hypothetical protein
MTSSPIPDLYTLVTGSDESVDLNLSITTLCYLEGAMVNGLLDHCTYMIAILSE